MHLLNWILFLHCVVFASSAEYCIEILGRRYCITLPNPPFPTPRPTVRQVTRLPPTTSRPCFPRCIFPRVCQTIQGIPRCVLPPPTTTTARRCTLNCQRGFVCEFGPFGGQRCVFAGPTTTTPRPCTLFCPRGFVCTFGPFGGQRCVFSGPTTTTARPCTLFCPRGYVCAFGPFGGQRCVFAGVTTTTPRPCPPCPFGYVCQYFSGIPYCVRPATQPPVCNLRCTVGYVCRIVQGYPVCYPDPCYNCRYPYRCVYRNTGYVCVYP